MRKQIPIIIRIGLSLLLLTLLQATLSAAPRDLPPTPTPRAGTACQALAPPSGTIVPVSSTAALITAVNTASPGDTISLADGTYTFGYGDYLRIDTANVTIRSASGDRDAVIIDGNYQATELVQIVASNVTIADLTLREAYYHPIHVSTDGDDTLDTLIYNVRVIDPGQQAIKINPGTEGGYPDQGTIACSHIELTAAGRPHIRDNCYTGGVDAHQAWGWTIRDNTISGFWCPSGLSEHAIHLWRTCRDPIVERNVLTNNARGIGFGMATSGTERPYPDDPCPGTVGYVDHFGGVIRNNVVFANDSALFASQDGFDCGICLWNACRVAVLHNTVAATSAPFSSIEWRFSNTSLDLVNNLVTHNLMDRGGTLLTNAGNLDNQPLSLFVDGANGDLHLAASASAAIDQGVSVANCVDDIDGDTRPTGSARDTGADEFVPSLTLQGSPRDQAIDLRWTVNTALPVGSTWRIRYYTTTANVLAVSGIASPTRNTSLTQLSNYQWYTVTLNAMLSSSPFLTDTVRVMPTDRATYLPLVMRAY